MISYLVLNIDVCHNYNLAENFLQYVAELFLIYVYIHLIKMNSVKQSKQGKAFLQNKHGDDF